MSKLKPASLDDLLTAQECLDKVRHAAYHLRRVGALNAAARVRSAVKSVEGAVRHMERRAQLTPESEFTHRPTLWPAEGLDDCAP